jgi:Protein of unknown function (DUF4007)
VATARLKKTSRLEIYSVPEQQFRFSGHETFVCRFAWLPKAYQFAKNHPDEWSNDEKAMVELGIGKNMVRSLRFWAAAVGLITTSAGRPTITAFGEQVFGRNGLDPYIEHPATPWLIHWKLASSLDVPLFSWHFMFNKWPLPEFTRTDILLAFRKESGRMGFDHSDITLSQHLDVFLHSYLPSRGNVSLEDSLEGPLTDLALLQPVGEKKVEGGRRETVYSFRRGRKPEISVRIFEYCLEDYWTLRRPHEATVSLRDLCGGDFSPGRLFLLSEDDIHSRLEETEASGRPFEYLPSAIAGRIVRPAKAPNSAELLRLVYGKV